MSAPIQTNKKPSPGGVETPSIWLISDRIATEGESSWKLWLFEFVDEFRRCPDKLLIEQAPTARLSDRLRCLLASTVEALCAEQGLTPPAWSANVLPLPTPWFVAETENLKASALVECPAYFRRRNVFVLGNFLSRA